MHLKNPALKEVHNYWTKYELEDKTSIINSVLGSPILIIEWEEINEITLVIRILIRQFMNYSTSHPN